MRKKVKIRYNHDAGNTGLMWRVIVDGKEHLAASVELMVPSKTSSDFIEGVGQKYHVSCEPEIIIWDRDNVVLKSEKKRISRKRHALKALTYRVYSSCITTIIALFLVEDIKSSISIGLADFFIKIVAYYAHERAWYHIPFGIK